MDVNTSTGRTLRYGVICGLVIVMVGRVAQLFSEDTGLSLIRVGIAVIIFTPMASIVVSAVALYSEKDYRWFGWVSVVLVISVVGFLVAYFY